MNQLHRNTPDKILKICHSNRSFNTNVRSIVGDSDN